MRWIGLLGCVLLAGVAWTQGSRVLPRPQVVAWQMNGRVVIPVRPVVERLGGTLTYVPANRQLTISLAGQSWRYIIGTDAEYPHFAYWNFWLRNGTIYCPVSMLAWQFSLPDTWNPRTREVTIATPQRTVTLPVRQPDQYAAPRRGTYPLLRVTARQQVAYLIGGIAQSRYWDDTEMARYVRDGARYTIYTLTERDGMRTAGRPYAPKFNGVGEFLSLSQSVPTTGLSLAAPWNALPRRPRRESPTLPAYQQLARAVLASRGMNQVTPRIIDAVTVDLDGDGRLERIVSATTARQGYTEDPQPGDYSFVAVQSAAGIRVLNGAFFPFGANPRQQQPNIYTLGGILDVDGDGHMEVVVHYEGFEWGGDEVYRVTPTRPIGLYSSYKGGI